MSRDARRLTAWAREGDGQGAAETSRPPQGSERMMDAMELLLARSADDLIIGFMDCWTGDGRKPSVS